SSFASVLARLAADAADGVRQIVVDAERSLEATGDPSVYERVPATAVMPLADVRVAEIPVPPDPSGTASGAVAAAAAVSVVPVFGAFVGGALVLTAAALLGKSARRRRREELTLWLAEHWNARVDVVDRHVRDRLDDVAEVLRTELRRYQESSLEQVTRELQTADLVRPSDSVYDFWGQLSDVRAELDRAGDEYASRLAATAQPLPPPDVIPTPGGGLVRYAIGADDFVMLDPGADGTVVSWSGHCTPEQFLNLCRNLAAGEPEAYGIVTIHGERIAGWGPEVLDAAEDRISGCDFIRWDLPDLDIAFHRLNRGPGVPPSVVISAVGVDHFGPELRWVARETTRPEVAAAVLDVAPGRWRRESRGLEGRRP
ncbi:hypothetical protein AB0M20_38700, partial [Actinoplanes sp. NPDC051633]|uniref:hypothetical protein n=1 Tax=Actinoplanes sp. NPDC051633 TaxID=3155670 RepID=UPI00344A0BDB